jgi:hypothetical protein
MPESLVGQVISAFEGAGSDMRCLDVCKNLERLGFVVKKKASGNHKVFNHPSLPDFHGSNFDCGHGKNAQVKSPYIKRNILPVLRRYREELKTILEG